MAILVLISAGIGHTSLGHRIERFGYDRLQKLLSSDRVPVTVLDINALKPAQFNVDGQVGTATPRASLKQLIRAISQQQPRAIAVDIDFSPDASGYIWPRDPEFFKFCLENEVPVFLGVQRNLALTPDKWLGSDYEKIAAAIIIPNDTRKMPMWIQINPHSARGPTMSAAVAGGFQATESKLSRFLHRYRLVEQVTERSIGEDVAVGEFPVDYSALQTLIENRTVRTINPDFISTQSHLWRGKIVLVGRDDPEDKLDRFKVNGFEDEVAGIYVHASAAYTLHNAPLYELTLPARVGIDLLLSLMVLVPVIVIRLYFLNRTAREVAVHRLQYMLTAIVLILALIGGVMFVGQTRVMWSDFILVLGLFVLHIPAERLFAGGHGRKRQKEFIHELLLEQESSGRKS